MGDPTGPLRIGDFIIEGVDRVLEEQELSDHVLYRYGKFSNYNTGNAIATLFTITSTVIGKITIPVMLS